MARNVGAEMAVVEIAECQIKYIFGRAVSVRFNELTPSGVNLTINPACYRLQTSARLQEDGSYDFSPTDQLSLSRGGRILNFMLKVIKRSERRITLAPLTRRDSAMVRSVSRHRSTVAA